MEKNLEIREGRQEQWKPTCTPCNFYFLAQERSSEHEERFPTIFFLYTCSYFYNNECTYVNTQKFELSTISGRSAISGRRAIGALKGRQLLLGLSSSNWRPQGARDLSFIFVGF